MALLGLAMPIFADGLKSFGDIDGKGLVNVGLGIGSLGLGILSMALATPGLLLAIPALIALSKIAPMISSGFADLAKVNFQGIIGLTQSLQPLGPAMMTAGTGLLSLSAGLAAFSLVKVASSGAGILSSIADGANKLLGGGMMDQLKALTLIGPTLGVASNGISLMAKSLASLSTTLSTMTGFDKLSSLVKSVNEVDLVKLAALSLIAGPELASTPEKKEVKSATSAPVKTVSSPRSETIDDLKSKEEAKPTVKEVKKPEVTAVTKESKIDKKEAVKEDNKEHQQTMEDLLAQLVNKNNELVSINKDMLRYIRAQN
jgi:hypothetical protein